MPTLNPQGYSHGEEIANAVTHGLGTAAAIVALTLMIVKAMPTLSGWDLAGIIIYGSSMIALFLSSTLYHSITNQHAKAILKRFDHSTIYLLIAGTYTPLLMIALHSRMAKALLVVVWSLALAGVVFKIFFVHKFKRASLITYLVMGWLSVIVVYELYQALSPAGFRLLIAGGLSYTLGAAFYAAKQYRYTHAIWHLFVLAGAACHCVVIAAYVIPSA